MTAETAGCASGPRHETRASIGQAAASCELVALIYGFTEGFDTFI
jgi:hypothetical protein